MSDEQTSVPEPDPVEPAGDAAPAPSKASYSVSSMSPCEAFLSSEVTKARKGLQMTLVTSVLLLLVLGGGMIYITSGFAKSLEPHTAAEIADGMISTQVNEKGPEIASQLKEKIPELIAQTPDFVLREIPEQRRAVEAKVDEELTKYCQSTADQLATQMDGYLAAHKEELKTVMDVSGDSDKLNELAPSLKQEIMKYLHEAPTGGGESVMYQIDQTLKALQDVNTKVKKLAANKGLTAAEKKTRRAIAILARAIEEQRQKLASN